MVTGVVPKVHVSVLFHVIMSTLPIYIYIYIYNDHIIQGSLEVKLPTIWTDRKGEVGRVREEKKGREEIREEKEREERRGRCAKR